eukprot:COSAG02_NODE_921_length_15917_cov_4.428057_13_plen_89_part_00
MRKHFPEVLERKVVKILACISINFTITSQVFVTLDMFICSVKARCHKASRSIGQVRARACDGALIVCTPWLVARKDLQKRRMVACQLA